jgi:hypothetical protein
VGFISNLVSGTIVHFLKHFQGISLDVMNDNIVQRLVNSNVRRKEMPPSCLQICSLACERLSVEKSPK